MKSWKKSGRKRAEIKTQKPRRERVRRFRVRPRRIVVACPSQEQWDAILLAAKKRRKGTKGLIAIAEAEGFTLTGEDPKERTHWRVAPKG